MAYAGTYDVGRGISVPLWDRIMPIVMQKVISSHVLEIGYDAETSELFVRFAPSRRNPAGAVAVYSGVDADTAESVMSAPSIGTALRDQIRDSYAFTYR
jgi:hypothetical protein